MATSDNRISTQGTTIAGFIIDMNIPRPLLRKMIFHPGVATVFYGNQVYATYKSSREMHEAITPVNNNEVYQSGYFYWNTGNPSTNGWFRMDATPVLLCDVPKELLLLKLILNL